MSFHCEKCDYTTGKYSNYIKHELTAKHKKCKSSYKPAETVAVVVQEHNSESSRESKDIVTIC
jgi:hypothetical protein